jgi:homoserine O-acetyltransferase/O-succinyltransferase
MQGDDDMPIGRTRRTTAVLAATAALLLATAGPGRAQPAPDLHVKEGDVTVADLTLADGEHIKDLRLHYTTLGEPHRDAAGHIDNAVVLLHGTRGTGKAYLAPSLAGHLFGPGQPLDAQRYYVVLPDGIGAGGSTKPSEGLRARFPHYGYRDQVDAQHLLLARLGVDHLRLVSGISQGGMQTWLWAERFPDAADLYVPIASMPIQISGRNLMWRQIAIAAIRNDPDYRNGDYDPAHKPTAWGKVDAPLFAMMLGTPERLQEAGPDRTKTLAFDEQLIQRNDARDANDDLYDFESSADYDPAPDLAKIRGRLVAINFADDQVNPAELPYARDTVAKLPSGQFVLLPGGYGHGSIAHAELWGETLAEAMRR